MSILPYTGEGNWDGVKLNQCPGQETDPLLLLAQTPVFLINVTYIFQRCYSS